MYTCNVISVGQMGKTRFSLLLETSPMAPRNKKKAKIVLNQIGKQQCLYKG